MGTRLNPDGVKIRALRIQRGWTQEQLAEIAGISLRTVQRAESANSAAFETMKAIAAAFEKDFDQLLKQGPDRAVIREAQPILSSEESCPNPAPEQIVSKQAALIVRRIWPIQTIALSALTVGLVIGITITNHLNRRFHMLPAASHSVAKILPDISEPFSEPQPQNKPPQTLSKGKVVRDPIVKTVNPNLEIAGIDKDSALPNAGIRAAKPADVAEIASLELIQPPASSELLPMKRVPMQLVFPDDPISETALSRTADSSIEEAQASGAVRQAVGLAVKKTGGFVSKARESIKRAF
jgi:transcriptional regulator with XRE-family HTH domain